MFANSARRVVDNTDPQVTRDIELDTQRRLDHYARHPEQIGRRLAELDREWDIERALATASSTLSLIGLTLGLAVDRRWLALPVAVQGFYLQHALQGWCPPLPVLRRLGVRTQYEIEEERYALKAMRGDLEGLTPHAISDRDRATLAIETVQVL